jgi:hypothetical protein
MSAAPTPAPAARIPSPPDVRSDSALAGRGSPYSPWNRPGGTAEPTREMHPYVSRGLYPDPGKYYRARNRDASVASAMDNRRATFLARPWRVLNRSRQGLEGERMPLSREAIERADRVRQQINRLEGGLPGVAARVRDMADQYGFILGERVLELDEARSEVSLADVIWLQAWQVEQWIQVLGETTEVALRFAEGRQTLEFGRFFHFAHRGDSRSPEGISKLRALWWRLEDIRHMLVAAAGARDAIGKGTRLWSLSEQNDSPEVRAGIRRAGQDIESETTRDVIIPAEATMAWDRGPAFLPDYLAGIGSHEHAVARVFGDTSSEEGVAVAGARAAVVEQRHHADLVEQGEALEVALALTRGLIWPIYEANGWPLEEAPYVWVTGWPDTDAWRALREWFALNLDAASQSQPAVLEEQDYVDVREALRLAFGVGADHV